MSYWSGGLPLDHYLDQRGMDDAKREHLLKRSLLAKFSLSLNILVSKNGTLLILSSFSIVLICATQGNTKYYVIYIFLINGTSKFKRRSCTTTNTY